MGVGEERRGEKGAGEREREGARLGVWEAKAV